MLNDDTEHSRVPRTFSTLYEILTMRHGGDSEVDKIETARTLLSLSDKGLVHVGWDVKRGEPIFWSARVPLDEVSKDSI